MTTALKQRLSKVSALTAKGGVTLAEKTGRFKRGITSAKLSSALRRTLKALYSSIAQKTN